MFGTIQSYNDQRGFGFILIEGRNLRFFHVKNFDGPISPFVGMRVQFDLGPSRYPNKPEEAIRVTQVPAGTGIKVSK